MAESRQARHPVDALRADQRRRWQQGEPMRVEDYLSRFPDVSSDREALLDLVYSEFCLRKELGQAPQVEEYFERFPHLAGELQELFEVDQAIFARDSIGPEAQSESRDQNSNLDALTHSVETPDHWQADSQDASASIGTANDLERIGRYVVQSVLGSGGFGKVYLASDEDLDRRVAIKVPHRDRIARPEDVDAYLAEARIVARLDHPCIVPVFDVGRTDDGLCYVVSKYIEGTDLARRIRSDRPSHAASAELVAQVAEALHHAHRHGVTHRDVKPGNILLDVGGSPYLADFGLALRDDDFGKGSPYAGTPLYMSPEQARGEGHRVDGRSDIFSLGAVFYELLTGRRPFGGESHDAVMEQVAHVDVRPPRMIDDTIPKELERICLKAMSKRATDRYNTALDLAEDLRYAIAQPLETVARAARLPSSNSNSPAAPPPKLDIQGAASDHGAGPSSDNRPIRIVPKGLRSFDEHDADFFLELLPGPRDRNGLPESIRFWKARIEESDADETFRVGLIYGPSGCGKSSLVKAGLLPRLSDAVVSVYVEAAEAQTEGRLLKALRRQCPDLPPELSLKDALAAVRRGRGIPGGKKLLIVVDQFEQWLHAHQDLNAAELAISLRQCDGERVQCLLLVRDDFGFR